VKYVLIIATWFAHSHGYQVDTHDFDTKTACEEAGAELETALNTTYGTYVKTRCVPKGANF
jgi:hypothetical protein